MNSTEQKNIERPSRISALEELDVFRSISTVLMAIVILLNTMLFIFYIKKSLSIEFLITIFKYLLIFFEVVFAFFILNRMNQKSKQMLQQAQKELWEKEKELFKDTKSNLAKILKGDIIG